MSCENHTLKHTRGAYKHIHGDTKQRRRRRASKASKELTNASQANERITSKYEIHIILCEFTNFRRKENKTKSKENCMERMRKVVVSLHQRFWEKWSGWTSENGKQQLFYFVTCPFSPSLQPLQLVSKKTYYQRDYSLEGDSLFWELHILCTVGKRQIDKVISAEIFDYTGCPR